MSKEIALTLDSRKRLGSTYLKLTKPKVVALMLVTAIVGMSLAPVTDFPWIQASIGLMGIGLMAGSAAAFNHLIDRRIDARMARTHTRPLPSGDTNPLSVAIFAVAIGVVGFVLLYAWVNALTAWMTFFEFTGLCGGLHHVFEASNAAKYCDCWHCRCDAATLRLDSGDG